VKLGRRQFQQIAASALALPALPAEFGRFAAAETEKWAKVIRAANIKPG
jgi:hypothetical protein